MLSTISTLHACTPALQHLASLLHLQRRWLATPRGHAREAGVRPHLLQALRFTVPQREAEETYDAYHHSRRNPLLASMPAPWDKCTETFLPFWVHEMVVEARASRAQVGRRVAVHKRVNNRTELVWETQWSWAQVPYSRTVKYEPDAAEMQVPATSRYLEGDMAAMRPGQLLAHGASSGLLQSITAPGVLGPGSRVVPFTVRPADARAQVLEWIRREESQLAEGFYKQATGSEEVRFLDLDIQVLQQVSLPIYVPVWVFRRALSPSLLEQLLAVGFTGQQAQAVKLYTLVSGAAPGVVSGSQVYNPAVAAVAAGLLGPLVLFASGIAAVMSGPALLLFGVAIPAITGAAAARHAPQLRQVAADAQRSSRQAAPRLLRGLQDLIGMGKRQDEEQARQRQEEEEASAGRRNMEDAWVRAYTENQQARRRASSSWSQHKAEQQSRQQQQQWQWHYQQQQQQQQQWGGGGASSSSSFHSARDPKGYYAALGVDPGASPQEVQEAFRAKALQHHPDKFPPEQKAQATERFKAISEAYTVLRNPSKRAAYNAGGHA